MKYLIASVLIFLATPLISQLEKGIKNIEEVRSYCEKISNEFSDGNTEEAFEIIKTILMLPENEISYLAMETMKQLNMIDGRYGDRIGYVKASEKGLDNQLHEIVYLIKYEYHALRLDFKFYKGKNNLWFMNKFKWDDSIFEILNQK